MRRFIPALSWAFLAAPTAHIIPASTLVAGKRVRSDNKNVVKVKDLADELDNVDTGNRGTRIKSVQDEVDVDDEEEEEENEKVVLKTISAVLNLLFLLNLYNMGKFYESIREVSNDNAEALDQATKFIDYYRYDRMAPVAPAMTVGKCISNIGSLNSTKCGGLPNDYALQLTNFCHNEYGNGCEISYAHRAGYTFAHWFFFAGELLRRVYFEEGGCLGSIMCHSRKNLRRGVDGKWKWAKKSPARNTGCYIGLIPMAFTLMAVNVMFWMYFNVLGKINQNDESFMSDAFDMPSHICTTGNITN